MKAHDLMNCGTVTMLDLVRDKDFGEIEVDLTGGDILRIIEILYDKLPEKNDFDKRVKSSLFSKIFSGKMNLTINLHPVLNKTSLRQRTAYKIRRTAQSIAPK